LEVSPTGGVAAAYRKLWDHYRDKDGENTRAAWTAKEWLPTRDEQHAARNRRDKAKKQREDRIRYAAAALDPPPAIAPAPPKPKPPPRGVAAARAQAQSSRQASNAATQRDATKSTRRSRAAQDDAARAAELSELVLASLRLARDTPRNFRYDDALHDERRKPTVLDRTPRLARMAPLRNELHSMTQAEKQASEARRKEAHDEVAAAAAVQSRSFADGVRFRRARFELNLVVRHQEWLLVNHHFEVKAWRPARGALGAPRDAAARGGFVWVRANALTPDAATGTVASGDVLNKMDAHDGKTVAAHEVVLHRMARAENMTTFGEKTGLFFFEQRRRCWHCGGDRMLNTCAWKCCKFGTQVLDDPWPNEWFELVDLPNASTTSRAMNEMVRLSQMALPADSHRCARRGASLSRARRVALTLARATAMHTRRRSPYRRMCGVRKRRPSVRLLRSGTGSGVAHGYRSCIIIARHCNVCCAITSECVHRASAKPSPLSSHHPRQPAPSPRRASTRDPPIGTPIHWRAIRRGAYPALAREWSHT
jgi:hypothetical protein